MHPRPLHVSAAEGRPRPIATALVLAAATAMASAQSPVEQPTRAVDARLALLVGVGDYAGSRDFRSLRGAVHDVALLRETLTERLGFATDDVKTLVDAEATLEGFLNVFTAHVLARTKTGTEVVLFFACHGSMIPDNSRLEADVRGRPRDSTLVLWDSRHEGRDGAFDLSDDALHSLLAALARKGASVTLLTDACHSGGIARGGRSGEPRFAGFGSEAVIDATLWPGWPVGVAFTDDTAAPESEDRVVHLSACGLQQIAVEHDFETAGGSRWHGVFSFCLAEALQRLQPGETFDQLARRCEHAMRAIPEAPLQSPWLVGDGTRKVLAAGFGAAPAGFPLRVAADGRMRLAAGYLHGLGFGAELDVRALGSPAVLGRVRLVQLGHASSRVDALDAGAFARAQRDVPWEAVLVSRPEALTRLCVFTAVAEIAARHKGSAWAEVQSEREDRGEYVLETEPALHLRTREGLVLWPKPGHAAGPDPHAELEAAFAAEQRFQDLWRLANEHVRGKLHRLDLEWATPTEADLARRDREGRTWRAAPIARPRNGDWCAPLPEFTEQERGSESVGELGVLRIVNDTMQRVFVTVVNLSESRAIQVLPVSRRDQPMQEDGAEARCRVWLGAPTAEEWPLSRPMRDRYLVIATSEYVDFSATTRGSDDGPVPAVLRRIVQREPMRGADQIAVSPAGWGLAWVDLWVERR